MDRFLVGFLLRVHLSRVQQFFVAVDLGLNQSILYLLGQVLLHHLERDTECSCNLTHVNYLVGRHVLLKIFVPNHSVDGLRPKEQIVF
jgi:hypothetical protein